MSLLNPKGKWHKFVRGIAKNPKILAIVAVLIPSIGLALGLSGHEKAFERSGSLLVCVAIFSFYINYFLAEDMGRLDSYRKSVLRYGRTPEILLRSVPKEIKETARRNIADQMHQIRIMGDEEHGNLAKAKVNIVHVEAIAGIAGTVIWGFGGMFFGN